MNQRNHPVARRGARLMAAAAALTVGTVMAMPSPAGAAPVGQQTCKPVAGAGNACITIGNYTNGYWLVQGGVDFIVPPGYGEELIRRCATPISAQLWGDDGNDSEDDFLANVPLKAGWPGAGGGLIGGEVEYFFHWSVLNEDDGTDEVYLRWFLNDCLTGRSRRLDTPNVTHNF